MIPTKSTSYSSSSTNYYAALEDDSDADTYDEAYDDAISEQAHLFCPPQQTLLRVANLGFLEGFPFLTSDLINKHTGAPPTSTPTYDPAMLPWPASKGEQPHAPSSSNPTAPHVTQTAPHVHLRHTRNNMPPPCDPSATPTSTLAPTETPQPTEEPTGEQEALTPCRSPRIAMQSPRLYSNAALSALSIQTYALT